MLIVMFPQKAGLDSLLSNKHLSIKDIQVENQQDIDKITIRYKIFNSATRERVMPLVRVRLFDKHQRLLKSHIVDHTKILLAPKQYLLIGTEFAPAPSKAEFVDIMIGNRLDFLVR